MILAWGAVLVFLAAAGRDLGWRLVDNRLVVILLLLWGAQAASTGTEWTAILLHMAIGLLAFGITLALYLPGWMGGGDVKLAAAVFLWAGPQHGLAVLVVVTLAGAVVAVAGMVARILTRLPLPGWAGRGLGLISTERGVPYGLALALGGIAAALASSGEFSGG